MYMRFERVPIFFSAICLNVSKFYLYSAWVHRFSIQKNDRFHFMWFLSYTTGELIHWGDEKKIGYHKFSLNPFKLIADNQNEMKGKTTKMPADDNFPAIFTRLYTYKWIYFFFVWLRILCLRCPFAWRWKSFVFLFISPQIQ